MDRSLAFLISFARSLPLPLLVRTDTSPFDVQFFKADPQTHAEAGVHG